MSSPGEDKGAAGEVMIGRDLWCVPSLQDTIQDARDFGFEFACVPLAHPRHRRAFVGDAMTRDAPFTRSDMTAEQRDWTTFLVGKVSMWIDVDSAVESHRLDSIKALQQELTWSSHLLMPGVMLQLRGTNCANLAVQIASFLGGHSQCWLSVPLQAQFNTEVPEPTSSGRPATDTWEWWNTCRSLCPTTKNLGLALVITADLPPPHQLARWFGEPIFALFIPTSVFLTNPKGFPVLSKAHQAVVKSLLRHRPHMVVSGSPKHNQGIAGYYRYLAHLLKSIPAPGTIEQFARGYEDQLQSPLQPLKDNLESSTYETFEMDPIKYARYQEAVRRALVDRVPDKDKDSTTVVLMVVGAGRGPLVRASLRAASEAGRHLRVYAVEKNPNAIVTLKNMQREEWGDLVTVVASDMREWEAPEKADILVSELLGSFGDNELSPECLDGAQKFLKDDGISIPQNYTSYLTPLSACKLHSSVIALDHAAVKKSLHTPYVVMIKQAHVMSNVQECFFFSHPNPDCSAQGGPNNTRYKKLVFEIPEACTMHGFAGYFESILYGDVMISIHPETHSPGMFSWFPIYFPIEKPMYCAKGCKVEVHFWRKVEKSRVWYEWAVVSPEIQRIHNSGGKANSIGL